MLHIISDILFCYVPTILFPLNDLSWIRFFGGWKNRGTALSPWIQGLSPCSNAWPWRRSFLVSGSSDSAPPLLHGSGWSLSATQIYRYQNMLCTNISILCIYLGFELGKYASQGCISCGTCSYLELTEDHVLTSAYVKIFRTVTRNAVNKSVWRKKDCFLLPLNKHAMNIWLSSLRAERT